MATSLGDYTVASQYPAGTILLSGATSGAPVGTPSGAPGGAPTQELGYFSRMVAGNVGAATTLIAVLILVILFMALYYCGIGPIGPFVACTCARQKKPAAAAPAVVADTETENLIDSINKA
jgi:hypothetical protein